MDFMEVFKYLTDEEKATYAALEETLSSAGWKLIVENAEKQMAQLEVQAAYAGTWEQNRQAIGAIAAHREYASLREMVEQEFAQIAAERREEANDVDVTDYE
jgi:hypothetical protein